MDTSFSQPKGSGNPPTSTTSPMLPSPGSSIRPDTNRKVHDEMQLNQPKDFKSRQTRIAEANAQREIFHKMFSTKKYIKFYTIEATNPNQNLARTNVIRANKDLLKALNGTKPKKVDEIRNGTLLVEVQSEEQGRNIQRLTSLDGIPVKISEHAYLNQTKGTIFYRNRCDLTEKEILDELAPLKVTNVYRTTRKESNETVPNNVYILTFNLCQIPEEVYIGYHKCRVREYIPRARRCFKCQGYQHSSKNCRSDIDICVNCGQESHGSTCDRPACCKNCNGNHPASSKECFNYKLATEIVIIQTKEKINYREAKYKALQYIPKPETSYSNAAKQKPQSPKKNPKQPTTKTRDHTPKPSESSNERKRTNSETLSDSEKKSSKKSKPQGAPSCSSDSPPVSDISQETAQLSKNSNQNMTNLQPLAPPVARKAAVKASKKIACQSSIELMDDDAPQTSSQTQRSRSTSRNRPKIPPNIQ